MQYRRTYQRGGCYFFTQVTKNRKPIFGNAENIALLRKAFIHVKQKYPFEIDAAVILPDHLHCIWRMPEDDHDFSRRWRLIKTWCTKHYSGSSVWQQRFWEHMIRYETDYRHHLDYIHFNPVKHGYVKTAEDWPYSSFSKFLTHGYYSQGWGSRLDLPDGIGNE
jgi:putative transposase